jgi:hypothetical protein
MQTVFTVEYSDSSATVTAMFDALTERVVRLTVTNDGYPSDDVYVLRVDDDGDVIVCELDDQGAPLTNSTWAIPQPAITGVTVKLGDFA